MILNATRIYDEKIKLENPLSPVTISGFKELSEKPLSEDRHSNYKLTCGDGTEYLILETSEVRDVLPLYCWKEVKIVGLLNKSNMTLIPQKVFPKGPGGKASNVIDVPLWKNQNLKRKVLHKLNELVVIPAAVFAVLAS